MNLSNSAAEISDNPTLAELQQAIDAMPALMTDKGLRMPDAAFRIAGNVLPEIWLRWAWGSSGWPDEMQIFTGDTAADAIAKARAWIDALPTPETKAMTDYMRVVAEAVDLGTASGIDEQYVKPLRITVRAMTDNLLTAEAGQ